MTAILPRKKTGEYMDKLNILNFALGIRAEEINENFDLIRYWIEAERLRTGGWGLVEGFELSKDISTMTIHVTEGILINEHGQEIAVPEHTFGPIPISHRPVLDTVTSDANAKVKLQYPIFSERKQRVIVYSPELANSATIQEIQDEIKIIAVDTNTELTLGRDVVFIADNIIQLTPQWADTDLRIEYMYAEDRFDAIFVYKDGSRYYDNPMPTGIITTSPSIQEIKEYQSHGWYLIGLAYWHIGQEVDVEFFTGDRTLRKVYVDRNNVLYLNGKPYEEKTVIYFTEPNPPTENDLWYDIKTEILYIWRPNENNEYEWQPVNDLARGITAVYQFQETENPDDLQTFDFFYHPEIFFMPGKHQITVIIDQVVIMEDQYEELFYGEEELKEIEDNKEEYEEQYAQLQKHLCGHGIKLKCPLERPSIVEIRVNHDLNTRRHDEDLFQHEYLFSSFGNYTVTQAREVTFATNCDYEPGIAQLEVYKNGQRLILNKDYIETKSSTAKDFCDQFTLKVKPVAGDIIDFRVLRSVSSYINFKKIVDEQVTKPVAKLREDLTNAINTFQSVQEDLIEENNGLKNRLAACEQAIAMLGSNKLDADPPLSKDNLNEELTNGIVRGTINLVVTTNATSLFLNDVYPTDFVVVSYLKNETGSPILLSGARNDYSLVPAEGGSNLRLNSKWLDIASAKVYVTGLKLGV